MTELEIKAQIQMLSDYTNILVTGPQRSGTTIAARIIAKQLNKKYVDENDCGVGNRHEVKRIIREDAEAKVIQCPQFSVWITDQEILERNDTIIVFMLRNIADICHSEQRIKWNAQFKKQLYEKQFPRWYHKMLTIGAITYLTYLAEQKPRLSNAIELHYEDLKHFPEWVEKEYRKEFKDRQWKRG